MIRVNYQVSSVDVRLKISDGHLDGEQLSSEDTPGLLRLGEGLGPHAKRLPLTVLELFKDCASGDI